MTGHAPCVAPTSPVMALPLALFGSCGDELVPTPTIPFFSETDAVEDVTKSKGYCAPYNGQVCRKYLQGRGLVWFNISQDNSGGWLNEQIAQNLHDELIRKLAEPCKSAAEALLCKYAFPDCTLK